MTPTPSSPPSTLHRRRFLQAGAAGAVVGATWVAPSVLSTPAYAVASSCVTGSNIDWALIAQNTPGKTILTSTAGWPVGTFGGTAVNFKVVDAANRLVYAPPAGTYPEYNTGSQPTTIDNGFTGFFSMLMNHAAQNDQATLTMTFSKKVKTLSFTIIDLTIGGSSGNGYIDKVILTAYNNFNGVGGTQAKVPIVATPGANVTRTNNSPTTNDVTAVGTATPNGADQTHNLLVTVAGPMDALVIQYIQNRNTTSANGTFQYVGITDMTWVC